MSRRRHTPEQIITALREAEVGLANGKTVGMVSRELGISEQTYYRWRQEFGGMKVDPVKSRGSSSMLRLGCLGDLLGFEKREIEVAAFAPDRSSPQSNRGDKAERTGSVGEGAGAPDPTLDLGVQALEAVRGA